MVLPDDGVDDFKNGGALVDSRVGRVTVDICFVIHVYICMYMPA